MKKLALDWIDARYYVDEAGDVFSTADSHGGVGHMKRLKVNVSNSGYLQVRLPHPDGHDGFKWFLVHRLVLRAFTGVDGDQGNHKNGVKWDNRATNLEWCTMSENMQHSYRVLGRIPPRAALGKFGALNPGSKRVAQLTLTGELVKVWDAVQDARRAGFSAGNISAVCLGKRRAHAGFVWKHI